MTDFAGTDFSQFPSWERVTAPTGATYYKVPGTGFVYDPFLSAQKGRPVLWADPRPALDEKNRAEQERQDLINQQKKAASPMGQLAPIGGLVAGGVAGKYLLDQISSPTVQAVIPGQGGGAGSIVMSDGSVLDAAGNLLSGGAAGGGSGGGAAQAFLGPYFGPGGGPAGEGASLAPGMFDIGNIGASGNAILPIVGALGAADLFANKRHGGRGALQGAASGAMIGSYFGPPGAAIGAGIGAVGGYFGNFGDKDRFLMEWNRKKALFDKGLISEAELGEKPQAGRTKEQLIAEEEAKVAAGLPGNVAFARERKESLLNPIDIQGYATIIEKAAETGLSRMDLAQRALAANAVREHHGTVDVDWAKVDLTSSASGSSEALPTLPTNTPGVPRVGTGPEVNAGPPPATAPRSSTLSPGIDLQGRRMTPQEMGRELARRADNRRRR